MKNNYKKQFILIFFVLFKTGYGQHASKSTSSISSIQEFLPSVQDLQRNDQHPVKAKLEEGEVVIDGARYRAFKSKFGTIYLPRLHYFSLSDVELARCTKADFERSVVEEKRRNNIGNLQPGTKEIPIFEISKVTSRGIKVYGKLLLQTIKKACGEVDYGRKVIPINISPEVGVSYESGETEYSIFLNAFTLMQ